jgi:hypothetical protein
MDALPAKTARVLAIIALTALAGCGADGEPVQPSLNAGVGVSSDGSVNVRGGVGLSQGPVSIFFGF